MERYGSTQGASNLGKYLKTLERHLRGSGIPETEWLDVVHSKMDGYIQSVWSSHKNHNDVVKARLLVSAGYSLTKAINILPVFGRS